MRFMLWITTCIIISSTVIAGGNDALLLPLLADDWDYLYAPEHYAPENLHEYINGAAELYLRYDLVEMVTTTYLNRSDSSLTFTVDLYKLASPLCAFGVYSFYRHAESRTVAIGNEAVVSSMNLRFWQDCFYVNIVAGSTDARMDAALREYAETLAAKLPASPIPEELSLLPLDDQLTLSKKYLHWDDLFIKGVHHIVSARYRHAEETWTSFVVLCRSKKERLAAEETLRVIPDLLFRRCADGLYLIGVRDFSDAAVAEQFLKKRCDEK